jgi:membrane-bound lytic murein transglycosylase B
MTKGGQFKAVTVAALVALVLMASKASAAQCGSTAAGFEAWKNQFAIEARARGVSASTVGALMATTYSTATIAADRGQRSFSLSLDQFLANRRPSGEAKSPEKQTRPLPWVLRLDEIASLNFFLNFFSDRRLF